jgi:hypothetical protein
MKRAGDDDDIGHLSGQEASEFVAYHWYPPFQRRVPFKLVPFVGLQEEFLIHFGPWNARVSIEISRVLRKAASNGFFCACISHDGGE